MPHSAQYSAVCVVVALVGEELADVEADAARADDRRRASPASPAAQHDVGVADDLRVIDAGDRRRARHDAGGEHDMVEAGEIARADAAAELQLHAVALDAAPVVAQRLGELLLAGDAAREVELPADLGRGVEQRHLDGRASAAVVAQARPAGPAPTTATRFFRAAGFSTISVSWQARGLTRHDAICRVKIVVEAGLVAGDAGVDLVGAARRRLVHEVRVGEKRPRHRHHVGVAAREHVLGHRRGR